MTHALSATGKVLEGLAARTDSVLVSFSGGKDSVVVLDLCSRYFKTIECFFMYLVPGMRCVSEWMAKARERYHVEIREYPHWLIPIYLREGVYCDPYMGFDDIDLKLTDVYAMVRMESGLHHIVTGFKRADGMWRRRALVHLSPDIHTPIVEWTKLDVMAYVANRGLPVQSTKGRAFGLELSRESLLWLYDNYPDDFALLEATFPYVGAEVKHRELYG